MLTVHGTNTPRLFFYSSSTRKHVNTTLRCLLRVFVSEIRHSACVRAWFKMTCMPFPFGLLGAQSMKGWGNGTRK
jgi:hypothetical protein